MGILALLGAFALILISISIVFIVSSFLMGQTHMAPYVPTRKIDLGRINKIAALGPGDVFYDIGCGDGRVCRYIGMQNPNVRVVGIEIAHILYLWNKLMGLVQPLPNVEIIRGNALKEDLSDASVVYLYGLTNTFNGAYKTKLVKELKSGARIISYVFSLDEWSGEKWKDCPLQGDMPINIYEVT